MLKDLISRMSAVIELAGPAKVSELDIERVTALLLIEIARADHHVDADEQMVIVAVLRQTSSLAEAELDTLVSNACIDANNAISLYDNISLVNEHFGKQNKLALVKQMWKVAVADGNIDRYEEYTIRKLCDLLYIKHNEYIQAKLLVLEGSGL